MLYREIGKSGLNASVIAFGAWAIGGWMWGGADEKDSIDAIHAAIDNGINLIDTAPAYGFGYSEEVVGKAVKDRRDKVLIATKCGLRWDIEKGEFFFYTTEKGAADESTPGAMKIYKYLHPESIRYEIEQSLRRLQTDYIDLYQTHWQDSTTPIEDTMAELTKLKDEGKIRAIGVSNATVEQIKKYGAIDSDQEKFNMLHRKIGEQGNLDYCHENNIALLAYSPLSQGLLTGKISPERKYNEGDLRRNNPLFTPENINKVNSMLKELEPIAEAHKVSVAQLICGWTFNRKGITHLLCGARNRQQVIENAGAGSFQLSQEDINKINSVYSKYFEK